MNMLRIALREGFRGHTVNIAVDGREVYHGATVTTPKAGACADVLEVPVDSWLTHVRVSVAPGDLVVSFRTDASIHPYASISLIGERTISCETSARPVRGA
jgi:hypothetical protein